MQSFRQKSKKLSSMVSGIMGVVYIALGLFLFFHHQLHVQFTLDDTVVYVFGAVVLVYGLFRVVKSWKMIFSYRDQ